MQEDPNKITYFAKTNSRGKETPFGVKRRDRARHMYVIGKTGMGKSTILENMAIQDIRNGEGMAFIDPHGSTAERIMEYVPEHRIKDVIYMAPFDMEYPIAFNVMEDVGYDKRHLVVSGLMSAFKKLWVDAWSARMEYILSNTLLALLEYEGSTLLDVNTMYTNKAFRKKVVDNVKDTVVKRFWTEEFANFTDRFAAEATPAIQNKVGQFTSNPLIRNIIGQPKSSFDIRRAMDEKKILIINLSKGRVGEVNASLLGSMLVTKIYLAAMSRADVPSTVLATLPNFYFYVDEFQNFANESFADILSEARKYKLNLIIAHQYIEQMEEEVRNAVFGNVGTTVAFRVGPFDAEVLETIFQPHFMGADLVNLGFAQIYLTLMIDGVGSPPFSATTLPPFDPPPRMFVSEVIAKSREQYGKPRAEVEHLIQSWNEVDAPAPTVAPTKPASYVPRSAPSTPGASPVGVAGRPRSDAPRPYTDSRSPVERRAPRPEGIIRPAPPHESVQEKSSAELELQGKNESIRATPAPAATTPTEVRAPIRSDEPVRVDTPVRRPESPRPTPARPVSQRVEEPRPPLEGATSLRDALRQVATAPKEQKQEQVRVPAAPQAATAPKEQKTEQVRVPTPLQENSMPPHVQHAAPDLKVTLGAIIKATPTQAIHTSSLSSVKMVEQTQKQHTPIQQPSLRERPEVQKPPSAISPVGLPEDVMRSMLAVDGFDPQKKK